MKIDKNSLMFEFLMKIGVCCTMLNRYSNGVNLVSYYKIWLWKYCLVTNINIRLGQEDFSALNKQESKMRVPISTYCKTKLTQDLEPTE